MTDFNIANWDWPEKPAIQPEKPAISPSTGFDWFTYKFVCDFAARLAPKGSRTFFRSLDEIADRYEKLESLVDDVVKPPWAWCPFCRDEHLTQYDHTPRDCPKLKEVGKA